MDTGKRTSGILGALQIESESSHNREFDGLAAQLYSMERVAPERQVHHEKKEQRHSQTRHQDEDLTRGIQGYAL